MQKWGGTWCSPCSWCTSELGIRQLSPGERQQLDLMSKQRGEGREGTHKVRCAFSRPIATGVGAVLVNCSMSCTREFRAVVRLQGWHNLDMPLVTPLHFVNKIFSQTMCPGLALLCTHIIPVHQPQNTQSRLSFVLFFKVAHVHTCVKNNWMTKLKVHTSKTVWDCTWEFRHPEMWG